MKSNINNFDLIIFGDFGVLTNTPFRDGSPLAMLPGRVEFLTRLREDRAERHLPQLRYAITGNKGGVACGLQTEQEAHAELQWTADQIGAACYAICFALEKPAAGRERYGTPEMLARRKPQPGMLNEIIGKLGVPKEKVLVVGNFADDCRAAKAAGVEYENTASFFYTRPERSTSTVATEVLGPVDDFDPFLEG